MNARPPIPWYIPLVSDQRNRRIFDENTSMFAVDVEPKWDTPPIPFGLRPWLPNPRRAGTFSGPTGRKSLDICPAHIVDENVFHRSVKYLCGVHVARAPQRNRKINVKTNNPVAGTRYRTRSVRVDKFDSYIVIELRGKESGHPVRPYARRARAVLSDFLLNV